MGWRGTLALAALLALAGVYAYIDAISGEQDVSLHALLSELRPTPPGQDAEKLLHYDPADIVAIHLQQGDVDLHVKRRDGKWVGVARPDALNDFLANLLTLAKIMTVDVEKQNLSDHGLDPPEAIVELQRADGSTISIRIGHHNPPLTGVYVQVGPSDRVILTGALILWELEKAVNAANPSA